MTVQNEGKSAGGAFSPEMVAIINRAYESAVERLGIMNGHSDRRAGLAKCVMELATSGETDESRLRDRAVAAVERTDLVRKRAQQLWEDEGRPHGRHDEHWHRAKQELDGSSSAPDSRNGDGAAT